MIESDGGVFRPLGFGFSGNDRARATVKAIATLLAASARRASARRRRRRHRTERAGREHAGDVARCRRRAYFTIHHTPADTIDKIDPADIARCAAALAVMGYVVADLPTRLGS